MTPMALAERRFSPDDQRQFARISGDWNPMHMDPVAARRSVPGAPVVHGLHLLLWMLDTVACSLPNLLPVVSIRARFLKWVYVGDLAEMSLVKSDAGEVRLQLIVNELKVATANFLIARRTLPVGHGLSPPGLAPDVSDGLPAAELGFHDLPARRGFVEFARPVAEAAAMFPAAARVASAPEIAALLCTTRLVGMVCPGLHSMFTGLTLSLGHDDRRMDGLDYAVSSVDERFRSVKIEVSGGGILGSLDTFARPPPVEQPPMAWISQGIHPKAFLGAEALVIGGSRGLGAFCAKAIAAGGGSVTISYAVGRTEAEAVAAEIAAWGGRCRILAFDARKPAAEQLQAIEVVPNAILYFATPTIYKPRAKGFDFPVLNVFLSFYVRAFYELCKAHQVLFQVPVSALYPSSVFVDERPEGMAEYAMAKAAGEVLCRELPRWLPGVRVLAPRLPRLPTDQTASVIQPAESASVATVILPILEELLGHVKPARSSPLPP